MELELPRVRCEKCGYERIPRTKNPLKCPRCGHKPGAKMYKKKEQRGVTGRSQGSSILGAPG